MKERKFFFDINNFDEEQVIEEEFEAPPPPPSFSLDELASAKEISFEEGRLSGLAEAETSRAAYIAEQLNTLATKANELIAAEQYRNALFEREVLNLVAATLEAAFPHLARTHGVEEIKAVISEVLQRNIKSPEIVIETPIDDAEIIQNHLDTLKLEKDADIIIKADPNLGAGSCRISWANGGAIRDHASLAHEILNKLKPSTPSARGWNAALATLDETDHNTDSDLGGES